MTAPPPDPGYFTEPHPSGSSPWTNAQWSGETHPATPTPAARFAAPTGPAPFSTPTPAFREPTGTFIPPAPPPQGQFGGSITPGGAFFVPAPQRAHRAWVLPLVLTLIALAVVLVILVLLAVAIPVFLNQREAARTGDGNPPPSVTVDVSPPKTSEPGAGGLVITTSQADEVFAKWWPIREKALVGRDISVLDQLTTGGAATFLTGAVACGCYNVEKIRDLIDTRFFVPEHRSYPAYFVVSAHTESAGSPWVEILVFAKAKAGAPWLAAHNSGYAPMADGEVWLGDPVTTDDGYAVPPSKEQQQRAKRLPTQLAALWQKTKETGRVPAQKTFVTKGQTGERLAAIARHRQDEVQVNGLVGHHEFFVDAEDPLFQVQNAGYTLACRTIRQTVSYRTESGEKVVQDRSYRRWGGLLEPGRYDGITSHNAWQTCFLIAPEAKGPVLVFNNDHGGSVPIGH